MSAKIQPVATAPKTCMRCGAGFWFGGKICPDCRCAESRITPRKRRKPKLELVSDKPSPQRPKRDNPELGHRVALLNALIREQRRAELLPGATPTEILRRLISIAERFRDAVCDDEPVLAESWTLRKL